MLVLGLTWQEGGSLASSGEGGSKWSRRWGWGNPKLCCCSGQCHGRPVTLTLQDGYATVLRSLIRFTDGQDGRPHEVVTLRKIAF